MWVLLKFTSLIVPAAQANQGTRNILDEVVLPSTLVQLVRKGENGWAQLMIHRLPSLHHRRVWSQILWSESHGSIIKAGFSFPNVSWIFPITWLFGFRNPRASYFFRYGIVPFAAFTQTTTHWFKPYISKQEKGKCAPIH